ncbi:hypothetical protein [Clostridium pasteurianum]|uniref:hypothetical protein n=1 Tax=Clostridium pasteurianum TaxID=1501 RepID=UPI003D6D3DA5
MKYKYVVAARTCASFGVVPTASSNSSQSVKAVLSGQTANPVINLADYCRYYKYFTVKKVKCYEDAVKFIVE